MKKKTLFILHWISRFLITYAILFSLIGTIALLMAPKTVLAPLLAVKKLQMENPKETVFMAVYRENLLKAGRTDTLFHHYVPLDSISPLLQEAVIAAEDDDFYLHPGFDVLAMVQAYEYNLTVRKIRRGASTLTQQLAKNLFLSSEKTFSRKYQELFYTLLMEHFLGKKRILELYLNYAQWGKTLFGVEAASQFYYKKPASQLTQQEAVRLAAVLAMPAKLSPLNPESRFLQQRMTMIWNNLYMHKHPKNRTDSLSSPAAADSSVNSTADTVITAEDSLTLLPETVDEGESAPVSSETAEPDTVRP